LKRIAIASVAVGLILTSCSSNVQPPATTAPTTSTTVGATTTTQPDLSPASDVSDAVGAAAQALLELPAMQALHVDYDENGNSTSARWLDWRDNGDLVLIVATRLEIGGIAQVGEELLTAATSEFRNEPWTAEQPPLPAGGNPGIVLALDLVGLAAGDLLEQLTAVPADTVEIENETTDDGGSRWMVRHPFGDAIAIREWTIDSGGRLRSYLLTSDTAAPIFGAFATSEFHFDPLPDPLPIVLPKEGTDLDIQAFDLPEDLPLPSQ
jgi:hypothetical protein